MENVIVLITIFIFSVLAQEDKFRPLISPPMGWRPTTAFTCDWNCQQDPVDCLNELLYVEIADILFSGAFRKSGYTMIQVDDCANDRIKGQDGRPTIDSWRFPTGIRFLSNYFHERGLEFAIKQSSQECPSPNKDYTLLFLDRLMELRTDMVQMDMCDTQEMLVFCDGNQPTNKKSPPEFCDIYHPRKLPYLEESWESLDVLIDYVIEEQDELVELRAVGKWIDFGELLIGSPELTHGQWRIQMSLFSIWSAPLMISVDLRSINKKARKILLNQQAIDINQDELGDMGRMVLEREALQFFVKKIKPCDELKMCSYAVAVINRSNHKITTEFKLSELGIPHKMTYRVQYAWSKLKFYKLLEETQKVNVTQMDAQLFIIIPLDLNGKPYEKQLNSSRPLKTRRRDKNVNSVFVVKKSTIEWISEILSLIVNLELIWLGGIAITASILFLAVKIDKKGYRPQNAPKLIQKTSI